MNDKTFVIDSKKVNDFLSHKNKNSNDAINRVKRNSNTAIAQWIRAKHF